MTADVLLDVDDLLEAIRAVFEEQLGPFTAHAGTLPVKAQLPYHLLTVRAPRLEGPMMAGDQTMEITLSVTTAGENADQASRGATAARSLLVGRGGLGAFIVEIPVPDRSVLQRECNYDGAPDRVAGVAQWTETYQLIVGRLSV